MSSNAIKGEEQLLERAFKLETIYKKYKVIIWAVVIAVVLMFVGKSIMQSMEESRLADANEAFIALQTNPDDKDALATLESKNPALFELVTFSQANKNKDVKALEALKSSTNPVIADASAYMVAAMNHTASDSELYGDMAILNEAFVALKANDTKTAKTKLDLIDEKSDLHQIATLLKHATLKGK